MYNCDGETNDEYVNDLGAYVQNFLALYNFKFQKISALGIRVFKMSTIKK
jgi:hypothetical protein